MQTTSDWIHSLTGADCFSQAEFAAGITAVGWVLSALLRPYPVVLLVLGWLASERTVYFIWGSPSNTAIRRMALQGLANPRREIYATFRPLLVTILILQLFAVHESALTTVWVGTVLNAYLEACDVQTPRKGWVREAWSRFVAALKRVPARA